MTATRYGDILYVSLIPFLQKSYPNGHRLYQDNDSQHTSRYIQAFFAQNEINWWRSPPESSDLNPIEKVWGSMKNFLRDKHKPRNMAKLKAGIRISGRQWHPSCVPATLTIYRKRCQTSLKPWELPQDIDIDLHICILLV